MSFLLQQKIAIRLFVNDHDPGPRDRVSDYVEPEAGVYRKVIVNESDWKIKGASAEAEVEFYSDEEVYGFFQTEAGGRILIGAQRFRDAPIDCKNGISITISVGLNIGA